MIRAALLVGGVLAATPAHADDDPGVLQLIIGHGGPTAFELHGRLIEDEGLGPGRRDSSRLRNAYEALKQLKSEEIEDATLEVRLEGRRFPAKTDEEGMFCVCVRDLKPPLKPGRFVADVVVADSRGHPTPSAKVGVRILPPTPAVGIISDVDDTIYVTEVTSKRAMIQNSLFKNAEQIEAVAGVGPAYRAAVAAGAALVFYVSGSPQNFLPRVQRFVEREKLPEGPILLKDFGTDPLFAQAGYKVGRIRHLLQMHPQLRFVLVGDSGESDPEVYARIRGQYPDRIVGIVIRRVPHGEGSVDRFAGMTVVDDFAKDPAVIANLLRAPKAP